MSTCGQRGGEPEIIPGQEARHRIAQIEVMRRHAAAVAAAQADAEAQSPKKQKKNKSQRRRKMGGSGLESAVVPFGLLAVQQWFGTRNKLSNKSIKNKSMKNKSMKNKSKKNRK